jgi:uncharacterized protein (TIGR02217 family)
MSGFADVYLPDTVRSFPWTSAPRFSTTIVTASSGDEQRNKNWKNPLRTFMATDAVRCYQDVEDLQDHFFVMSGPVVSFPMRDPLDFTSRRLKAPNNPIPPSATDQLLGVGDGVNRFFPLTKTYTRGGLSYVRKIDLPIVDSCLFALNGLPPETPDPALPGGPYVIEVDRYGGKISIDHAPGISMQLTGGFMFDVPARFEADDSFDRIITAYEVDGFSSLNFLETRFCCGGASS